MGVLFWWVGSWLVGEFGWLVVCVQVLVGWFVCLQFCRGVGDGNCVLFLFGGLALMTLGFGGGMFC